MGCINKLPTSTQLVIAGFNEPSNCTTTSINSKGPVFPLYWLFNRDPCNGLIPGSYMCALFPPLPSKAKIQVVQTEKGRCKQKRSLQEDLDRFPLPEFMAYQSWPNRFNIDTLNLNVFITSPLTSQNDIHLIISYLIMEPIPTHLFIHPEQLPFRHMVMANDRRWGASAGEHSPKRIPLMHWRRYRL